ncbi:MAG: GrpB family protein [Hamadaea sp.]|nr:GrpB family protein [Hamadaea sp.]
MTAEGYDHRRADPIVISAYDPAWPQLFAREQARVEQALRPWLSAPVEHIGSTSVPGLPAKPIIDMLGRLPRYAAELTPALTDAMAAIGWVHAPEPADHTGRKWSYCFPAPSWRTHHLHLVEDGSDWPTLLAFRDHLRAHPGDAAEYARIKTELAAADNRDRPRYRTGKAPFIAAVLDRIERR